jgi:hypothetical protein
VEAELVQSSGCRNLPENDAAGKRRGHHVFEHSPKHPAVEGCETAPRVRRALRMNRERPLDRAVPRRRIGEIGVLEHRVHAVAGRRPAREAQDVVIGEIRGHRAFHGLHDPRVVIGRRGLLPDAARHCGEAADAPARIDPLRRGERLQSFALASCARKVRAPRRGQVAKQDMRRTFIRNPAPGLLDFGGFPLVALPTARTEPWSSRPAS